jgi:hypothetical protein
LRACSAPATDGAVRLLLRQRRAGPVGTLQTTSKIPGTARIFPREPQRLRTGGKSIRLLLGEYVAFGIQPEYPLTFQSMAGTVRGEVGAVGVAQAVERGRGIDGEGLAGGCAERGAGAHRAVVG